MIEALHDMRVDPNTPLELLNGCSMVLEIIFLAWMARYIVKEALKRGLTLRQWVHGELPYSVNFVVAVFFFDSGICLRTIVVWYWRRFYGGGDFGFVQL